MKRYILREGEIDKNTKSTLTRIYSIIQNPTSSISSHFIPWDGKYFVYLHHCPNGKWEADIVTENGKTTQMHTYLNTDQVVGWVYNTLNRTQYLKYNKHSKLARPY